MHRITYSLSKKNAVTVAAVLSGILLVAGLLVYRSWQRQLNQPMNLPESAILTVKPGDNLTGIAGELRARGWIKHPYILTLEGRRLGLDGFIKAGEYEVKPGLTPRELLALLVAGKVIQYALTIPEGWTYRQILDAVHANPHLRRTLTASAYTEVMEKLGHAGLHPEGWFFPDTYHFPSTATDLDFMERAYQTMVRVLAEEWEQRDPGLPYEDPYQALIMASIIEKETAVPEERNRIAGVFARRLQRGIRLQTDPTVIYGIGPGFNGDITARDLTLDTPYNTYLHPGLPPTPIASPGRDSIRAALHPEDGKALYFVATGDGRHYFSETLDEHNRAVSKYQTVKP
jgi:UPF0755 protein